MSTFLNGCLLDRTDDNPADEIMVLGFASHPIPVRIIAILEDCAQIEIVPKVHPFYEIPISEEIVGFYTVPLSILIAKRSY